jgi:hypothetical protein
MKTIHIEVDCHVTDRTAQELMDAPDICLEDNIADALDITDECEYVHIIKITKLEGGDNDK